MTEDAVSSSTRRRALRAMLGALLAAAIVTTVAAAESAPDPRVGLAPGFDNAGVAANGLELLANRAKAAGFFDPANPGSFAFVNSDLAFQGDYAFVGNFNGFQIYDISDPANPQIRTAVVCPGGQGEVSVYGNLLFMSAEETRARTDCGAPGRPDRRSAALPRRPHLRHLEPRLARPGRGGADVSRLAYAHAIEEPERQREPLRLRLRDGRRSLRRPRWRAASNAGASDPNSSFYRDRRDQGAAGGAAERRGRERVEALHRSGHRCRSTASRTSADAAAPVGDELGPDADDRLRATTSRRIRSSGSPPEPARATGC